jgi:hypothetical protein
MNGKFVNGGALWMGVVWWKQFFYKLRWIHKTTSVPMNLDEMNNI